SARFLPELNAIAGGLAGATKVRIIRFVFYGVVSASAWAGGWIGLGYFLSHAINETAARLGVRVIVLFLAPFALYLLFHRARRRHVIRVFRQSGVGQADLSRETGNAAAGLDLHSDERDGLGPVRPLSRPVALCGGAGDPVGGDQPGHDRDRQLLPEYPGER